MIHQSAKNLSMQLAFSFFLNIYWSADNPSLSTIHAIFFSIHLNYLKFTSKCISIENILGKWVLILIYTLEEIVTFASP